MDATMMQFYTAMRRSYTQDGPPDLATRVDRVDRVRALVDSNSEALAEALCSDYGTRSVLQTLVGEGLATGSQLRHTRRRIAKWMRPQRRWAGAGFALIGGRAHIEWQPLGVVGLISPWNFPVALTLAPLGQALAAGNRVMCKVSEMTPATAKVLHDAVHEWFDPTEVHVVTGGAEAGAEFTGLPFDHLFFTGSGAVGRQVMRAAANNLTPVTLELGGKSPLVVGPGADIAAVARTVIFGKTFNAGQFCVAPDRVFVPDYRVDEFIHACHRVVEEKDPRVEATAIVNEHHYARLRALLDDARERGATEVVFSGASGNSITDTADRLMPPIALVGIDESMVIAREEVFGPLFSIHPYARFDDVINEIKVGPQPLAAYYFGPASRELDRFVTQTSSGGVVVNDIMLQVGLEHLPFGGVGQSGLGVYHGRAGFATFSHGKPVVRTRWPLTPLLSPPYPRLAERLVRSALRAEATLLEGRVRRRRSASSDE